MKITRVAFGSGKIDPDVNPADVHALLSFVADGTVAERRHEADRLFLTIRYTNQEHQDVTKMFLLSEFMIFVEDPESGTETDLLYGTLGDYRQPVPAYTPAYSPSIFSFPLVLVISDDVHVEVDVPVGIATYYDLEVMAREFAIRHVDLTIQKDGWVADTLGKYRYLLDVVVAASVETGLKYGATSFKGGIKGDFLVTTSDQKNTSETAGDRLASTVLTLKDDMITDGASIFVAGQNYTFSTGKDTVMPKGAVKVDISDLDAKKLGDGYMSAVAKRLTDAYAADNTGVYTMGWNGKNVTVTETKTHADLKSDGSNNDTYAADGWDLRTMNGIAKSLGYSSAATNGKALTLQIGDTSDKFNQMAVSVGDMHTSAMGSAEGGKISDVDISTQDGASAAVGVIKDAINYVSSIRGDLGAIQNRLDHTINNLSVMTENIQDAESTIRDTDVAAEMMQYTKNNILIQSAQAMLAQANQMPQGVLQLLG